MAAKWKRFAKIGVAAGAAGLGAGAALYVGALVQHDQRKEARQSLLASQGLNKRPSEALPTRSDQLRSLSSDVFDVLVIGGGATGAGCALDAQVTTNQKQVFYLLTNHSTALYKFLHCLESWSEDSSGGVG